MELEQLDLTRPPYSNWSTSREAAESVKHRVAGLRRDVYWAIRAAHGATCDEIEGSLELSHQTASARVRELAQYGHIHDSGLRRKTRSGRKAIVWRAGE